MSDLKGTGIQSSQRVILNMRDILLYDNQENFLSSEQNITLLAVRVIITGKPSQQICILMHSLAWKSSELAMHVFNNL